LHSYSHHPHLHSFPTRRSSDLYRQRLKLEQELLVFRIIQELITNIIKHSNSGFIHLTQNANNNNVYFRIHHDGQGIVQTEFDKRSEEHTSELQSRENLVCRLLL